MRDNSQWTPDSQWTPEGGFTLLELMVALALAAVISLLVSIVGTQAQELYRITTAKVETYQNLRYVTNDLQTTLEGMVPTADMEFFVDSQDRRNNHWDPGEEIRESNNIEGGRPSYYDEGAFIVERNYNWRRGGLEESHDCYSIYFKAPVQIDGETQLCNVEYFLARPEEFRSKQTGEAALERVPEAIEDIRGLVLVKTVRYVVADIDKSEVNVATRTYELIRNITDLKFEYYYDNPFDQRPGGFFTPNEEKQAFGTRAESKIVDDSGRDEEASGYLKEFLYGGLRDFGPNSRGEADAGNQRQTRETGRFEPMIFSVGRGTTGVQFSQLLFGSKIYVWTEQGQSAGGDFTSGDYTVFRNEQGRLEFVEQVDTGNWERQSVTSLRFRAGYVPSAIRVTIRILNDKGTEPRTHAFVVHPFRRL